MSHPEHNQWVAYRAAWEELALHFPTPVAALIASYYESASAIYWALLCLTEFRGAALLRGSIGDGLDTLPAPRGVWDLPLAAGQYVAARGGERVVSEHLAGTLERRWARARGVAQRRENCCGGRHRLATLLHRGRLARAQQELANRAGVVAEEPALIENLQFAGRRTERAWLVQRYNLPDTGLPRMAGAGAHRLRRADRLRRVHAALHRGDLQEAQTLVASEPTNWLTRMGSSRLIFTSAALLNQGRRLEARWWALVCAGGPKRPEPFGRA